MFRFIIRRLIVTIPMILVVVSLTWALIRLAPGNFYTGEKPIPPAIEENLRAKYGLDQPWYVQYGKMLGNTLRGDFGNSLRYQGQSVNEILFISLPVSASIGFAAYLVAALVGVTVGVISAVKQNTRMDYTSMGVR